MWNSGRQPGLGDHLVKRVGEPIVREEGLQVGVELEPARPLPDEAARFRGGVGPMRIDRHERDQHVAVGRRDLQDLVVRDRHLAGVVLAVDAEDHRRHRARAVVVGDLLRVRAREVRPEVLRRRVEDLHRSRDPARRRAGPARACARRWREIASTSMLHSISSFGSLNAARLELRREPRLPDGGDGVRVPAAVAQLGDDLGRVRVETEPVAADPDRLSGDPGGAVRGEKHDQPRAILGHPDRVLAAHRRRQRLARRDPRRQRLVDRDGRGHRRPGGGDDGVDGDLRAGQLQRPGPREAPRRPPWPPA